jgi:hypothetical protein
MNLPSSVRVGYRDFSITEWPWSDARDAAGGPFFGDCNVNHSAIRVCTDFGPQRTCNTVVHELLHACWSSACLGDKEPEEKVVQALADQLTQVFRDNPELILFLSNSVHVPS